MDEYSIPEYYKSTKWKDKLSYCGFRYHHDRKYSDREYWKCEDRSCRARAVTNKRDPDLAQTVVQKSVCTIRSSSKSSHEAPSSIINREPAQKVCLLNSMDIFQRKLMLNILFSVSANKHVPSLPKCLGDVSITGQWTQTVDGEEWLICDKTLADSNKFLIFCNAHSFSFLIGAKVWYGEGTFGITPQHFYQLYTLHASVGG